jgi:2-polyprenyl-3-methyl-5-hydroxy-6-metoxy-1,4-benzoquinol methylase
MIKNKLKRILIEMPILSNNVAAFFLTKTGITQNYQPLSRKSQGMRSCIDRLDAIKGNICNGNLCLDIGCNTGYFSNEISKLGIFTIGLESELKNVIVAKSQYSASNLIFKQFNLDKDSAKMLPKADIILFLSVFHHLVKYYGKDNAIFILKKLASKCKKQFFFETGQMDESGTKWSYQMGFINNINFWVSDFFIKECRFKEVKCLGEFETFLTPTKRKLFLAIR